MAPGDGDFDSAPGYPDRLTCQVASDSVGHLIICGCCGQQDLVDSGQELVKHSVLSQRSSHWNGGGPLHVLRRALGEDNHALHNRLLGLRKQAGPPDKVSVLRVLDVIAWMEGTHPDSDTVA